MSIGLFSPLGPWAFGRLRPHGYNLIVADPPWRYEAYSERGEAKQDVVDPKGNKFTLSNSQTFKVVAPRFNLPSSDVHSFYPPSGGTVSLKMLPHITFKDPHLPWERQMVSSTPPKDGSERLRIPWLALWVLRPDELVSPGSGIFAGKALSSTRAMELLSFEV